MTKIIIAQPVPAVAPAIEAAEAIGGVSKAVDTAGGFLNRVKNKLDSQTDKNGNPTYQEELDQDQTFSDLENKATSAAYALGFDKNSYILLRNTLAPYCPGGNPQADKVISELATIASSSSTTLHTVSIIAVGLLQKNVNLSMSLDTLKDIAKYESDMPGIGVWPLALKAINGEAISNDLMQIRMSYWARSDNKDLSGSNNLAKLLMSLGAPVGDISKALHQVLLDNKAASSSQSNAFLIQNLVKSTYWQKSEQKRKMFFDLVQKDFPEAAKSWRWQSAIKAIQTLNQWGWVANEWAKGSTLGGKGGMAPKASTNAARIILGELDPSKVQSLDQLQKGMNKAIDSASTAAQGIQTSEFKQNILGLGVSTQDGNKVNQSISINSALEMQYKELESSLKSLIATQSGAQAYFSQDSATGNSPVMTPGQIKEVAQKMAELTAQGIANIKGIIAITQTMFTSKNPDVLNLNQDAVNLKLNAMLSTWLQRQIVAFDLYYVGPTLQEVETIKPYITYYEAQIAMLNATVNGVGAMTYVAPLVSACNIISEKIKTIIKTYSNMLNMKDLSPETKQFVSQQVKKYTMEAANYRNKGIQAMAAMAKGAGHVGLQSLSSHFDDIRMKRYAEDILKEVTSEEVDATTLEEEWHKIYQGTDADGYSPRHDNRPNAPKPDPNHKIRLQDL